MSPDDTTAPPERDAAWVTVATPFTPDELREFLADVERLFRINSGYAFDHWIAGDDGRHRARWKNLGNGRVLEADLVITPLDDGIKVAYSDGLKSATTFRIETTGDGTANIVITDDYSAASVDDRENRIDEVDQTLVAWGHDLFRYLRAWKKWGRLRPWRWYMRKVWQPMRPMARRITYLLFIITVLEFVAFLAVFAVFALELDRQLGL